MASTTVRELLTVLGVKADDKQLKIFDEKMKDVKKTMVGMVAGAAAVGAGLFGLAHHTAQVADEATKAAQRLGITGQQFQEMTFAAIEAGAGGTEVETAFRRMSATFDDAVNGGKNASQAWQRLGLDVRKLRDEGTSQIEIFEMMAEGFKNTADETVKMGLANDVLGRAGAKLMPILNLGADGIRKLRQEANNTGAVFTTVALKDAEVFNDRLFEMKEVMRGVRNTIGLALIPVFTDMFVAFKEWFNVNRAWVRLRTEHVATSIADAMRKLGRVLMQVDKIVQDTVGTWGNLFQFLFALLATGALVSQIYKLVKAFEALQLAAAAAGVTTTAAFGALALEMLVLIGAFVLLALALEDVWFYFTGGESAIGEFTGWIDELSKKTGVLAASLDSVVTAVKLIKQLAGMPIDFVGSVFEGKVLERASRGARVLTGAQQVEGPLGGRAGRIYRTRKSFDIRRYGSRAAEAAMQDSEARASTTAAGSTVNYKAGDITVNETGLSQEQLKRTLSENQDEQARQFIEMTEGMSF